VVVFHRFVNSRRALGMESTQGKSGNYYHNALLPEKNSRLLEKFSVLLFNNEMSMDFLQFKFKFQLSYFIHC
jgi:hypothetical protein